METSSCVMRWPLSTARLSSSTDGRSKLAEGRSAVGKSSIFNLLSVSWYLRYLKSGSIQFKALFIFTNPKKTDVTVNTSFAPCLLGHGQQWLIWFAMAIETFSIHLDQSLWYRYIWPPPAGGCRSGRWLTVWDNASRTMVIRQMISFVRCVCNGSLTIHQ